MGATSTTRFTHLAGVIVAGLAFWLAPGMPTYRAIVVLIGGTWAVGLIGSAVGSFRNRCSGQHGNAARLIPEFAHKNTRHR